MSGGKRKGLVQNCEFATAPTHVLFFFFPGYALSAWRDAPLGSIFVRPKIDEKAAKGGDFPRLVESTPLVLRSSASNNPRPGKSPTVPGDATTPGFHGSWPYGWAVSMSGPFLGAAAVPSRRNPGFRQPGTAATRPTKALEGRQRTACLAVRLARSNCFPGLAPNQGRP